MTGSQFIKTARVALWSCVAAMLLLIVWGAVI